MKLLSVLYVISLARANSQSIVDSTMAMVEQTKTNMLIQETGNMIQESKEFLIPEIDFVLAKNTQKLAGAPSREVDSENFAEENHEEIDAPQDEMMVESNGASVVTGGVAAGAVAGLLVLGVTGLANKY